MDAAKVIARYREAGQKITPQRLAVLRALEGNHTHPTAAAVVDKVHRDNPYISPATVYRVLNELTGMGELQPLPMDDGTVHFEPNTDGHAHLLCERCGRIDDADWFVRAASLPEERRKGYRLTSAHAVFRGICPACQGRPRRGG